MKAKSRIVTTRPDRLWGLPSLLSNGYRGRPPGTKRLGREADHSPLSSTYVENAWLYAFTPQVA